MLKVADLRNLDVNAIDGKVAELRRELFGLSMEKAASGIEKPHRLKNIKRSIARCLTVKNELQKGK